MIKRPLCVVAMAMVMASVVQAQQAERFSVATLNVDGLPQKLLVFKVNADGPGAEGSSRIGKYLLKKAHDIVCMQEDFNYHGVLTPWLEDDYRFDDWSGGIEIDNPNKKIDLLHAQNERFECDGLVSCWKKTITLTASERVAWKETFGKFSHAGDELVTKGFRRYELTLASGIRLIVYNMHMDAGSDIDEQEGVDTKDREARLSEWQQLKEDVLAHLDTRPVIIMGDLNSYFCRDQIKAKFIDAIAETGKGTVADVWVELGNKNVYPTPVDGIVSCTTDGNILESGETLDKILYINPAAGTKIKPVSYQLDEEGYKYNGKMLGDHYPLSATFEIVDEKSTGIDALHHAADEEAEYYNLNGLRISKPTKGLYIERRGNTTSKHLHQ